MYRSTPYTQLERTLTTKRHKSVAILAQIKGRGNGLCVTSMSDNGSDGFDGAGGHGVATPPPPSPTSSDFDGAGVAALDEFAQF